VPSFATDRAVQRRDDLDCESIVISVGAGGLMLVLVADLDELEPVGTKACRSLDGLLAAGMRCWSSSRFARQYTNAGLEPD
jgi:hypothetical protein